MTDISDWLKKESEKLPPGIYATLKTYEGVKVHESISAIDQLPKNVVLRRYTPAYAMEGNNTKAWVVPNQGSMATGIYEGSDFEEFLTHETQHLLAPDRSEIATRNRTAAILHERGADLGSHSGYFRNSQSKYDL